MQSDSVVGIITYRRAGGLTRLLKSLVPELYNSGARVVVVDNDTDRSAEAVCIDFEDLLEITYGVEAKRGVSHPRNLVLELAGEATKVIFLDDDEWVDPGWYRNLMECSCRYPDALITGPVRYQLPNSRRLWADQAGYFQTAQYPDHSIVPSTGAGNTLIPAAALSRVRVPRFDSEFSFSGGEDHELFGRLQRAGCVIRWAAGATVNELVPAERATARWVRRRSIRSGYIRGRILLRDGNHPIRVGTSGVGRILLGLATYPLSLLGRASRRGRSRATATLLSGCGFVAAVRRNPVEEYGLDDSSQR